MEYEILQKYFIKDIIKDIFKYANEYVLLEWLDITKIDWGWLSINPHAIDLLMQNKADSTLLEKINWSCLSQNPNAIDLLKQHEVDRPTRIVAEKINWVQLSLKPNAIDL